MVITEAQGMIDFAALIERAVERDLRNRFLSFLGSYKHVEFGRARPLSLDEAAMILTCVDTFLTQNSVVQLGVADIAGLRERLNRLAHGSVTDEHSSTVANACFDALACITALEARLCMALDGAGIRSRAPSLPPSFANDD